VLVNQGGKFRIRPGMIEQCAREVVREARRSVVAPRPHDPLVETSYSRKVGPLKGTNRAHGACCAEAPAIASPVLRSIVRGRLVELSQPPGSLNREGLPG
jgi:hypothetical protein